MRRFEYHEPTTLQEASSLLTELGEGTFILAGGTDLFVEIRELLRAVRHLVNIKRIPGLDGARFDADGLRFGALVTAGRLERMPEVARHYPNLRAGLRSLGSIQVRNRATVVGNICRASPSADTIPPLVADGAEIETWAPGGGRRIALADFFAGPGRSVLAPGEIATGIRVPAPAAGSARLHQARPASCTCDQYILDDRVRFWGEGVAAVAAVSEEIADEALDLIDVEYEPLPAVYDIDAAQAPGAPLIHEVGPGGNLVIPPVRIERGDVEKGFAEADLILEGTFEGGRPVPTYMEPNVCVAEWGRIEQADVLDHVLQAVHDLVDLRPDHPWGTDARQSRMVFIGRDLDRPALDRDLRACLSDLA